MLLWLGYNSFHTTERTSANVSVLFEAQKGTLCFWNVFVNVSEVQSRIMVPLGVSGAFQFFTLAAYDNTNASITSLALFPKKTANKQELVYEKMNINRNKLSYLWFLSSLSVTRAFSLRFACQFSFFPYASHAKDGFG